QFGARQVANLKGTLTSADEVAPPLWSGSLALNLVPLSQPLHSGTKWEWSTGQDGLTIQRNRASLTGKGSGFAPGRSVSSVGVSFRPQSLEPLKIKGIYFIVTRVKNITISRTDPEAGIRHLTDCWACIISG
ncbi:MAG TPA: hypothetical protein VFV81_01030, partial [Verrucomicrobiae bacterium]|nr:hypothetical protein [Verrucomicrobiae bacterium]